MAKTDPVADALAQLKGLDPQSPGARDELAKALKSKSNLVVARAATIVHDFVLPDFTDALAAAFERFMLEPAKTDKGCNALTAITKALYETDADAPKAFLRGIRHLQPEPVWGGTQDTAADLRGWCALGLVRCNYREVLTELADLLMDPEPPARHMAARAIGYNEDPAGAPLLRMKVLGGDPTYEVIAECLSSLVKITPRPAIEFLARLLDTREGEVRDAAVLALGESRQPAALDLLRERFDREPTTDARKPLLLAIAMTRLPAGVDFLLATIAEEHRSLAAAAVEAMAIYRSDDAMRQKLAKIVDDRDDKDVSASFAKAFE